MRTLKPSKFMEENTMKLFIKTNNKETRKLPMTGKVRKGFRTYCSVVIALAIVLCITVTAFAEGESAAVGSPLNVISNLWTLFSGLSVR